MQPPEAGAFDGDVALQRSYEALARGGRHRLAFPFGRFLRAGEFEDGRHDVDDMSRGMAQFAVGGDARRPGGDEGRADAAFVHPGLMATMRRVGGAGEAGADAQVSRGATQGGLLVVAAVADHDLGAGAVVGREEDDGVLVGAHGFELGDDAADLRIHAVDHRGVDGHLGGLEAALLVGEFSPWQWAVHFAGPELGDGIREGVGRPDFAFEGGEGGVRDAQALLALVASGAEGFPAGEILVAILGDILRQGLQREVRRNEWDVMEERLVLMVGRVVLEAVDGVVGRRDRGVVALLVGGGLYCDVVDEVTLRAEVVAVVAHIQRTVEARGEDRAVDMPLAAMVATVAGGLQVIGKQARPGLTDALAAAGDAGQGVAVDLLGVVTGEQGAAGGPAASGVIELGEAHAVVGEAVEVRRGDLAAVAAEVGEAQVVGEDQHDIGSRRRGGEGRQGGENQGEQGAHGGWGKLRCQGAGLQRRKWGQTPLRGSDPIMGEWFEAYFLAGALAFFRRAWAASSASSCCWVGGVHSALAGAFTVSG